MASQDNLPSQIHSLLSSLTENVLSTLRLGPSDLSDFRIRKIVTTGEGAVTIASINAFSGATFVLRHWSQLSQAIEIQTLESFLISLPSVQRYARASYHRGVDLPLSEEYIRKFVEQEIVKRFVWNLVELPDFPTHSKAAFESLCGNWENLLLTGKRRVRCICLLQAFSGIESAVTLGSCVTIRKACDLDFSELADVFGESSGFGNNRWLLEIRYEDPADRGLGVDSPHDEVLRALTALRLTKSGDVHVRRLHTRPEGDITVRSEMEFAHPRSARSYKLHESDLGQLSEMWRLSGPETVPSEVDFATRRFNFGFDRWRVEDRITDHVIALEALYVPDSLSGEIGYKLQVRGTAVLGENRTGNEREQIRKELKTAYSLRSALVHGESDARIRRELRRIALRRLDEFVPVLEDLLRQSIVNFLRIPGLLKADVLDRLVLGIEPPGTPPTS